MVKTILAFLLLTSSVLAQVTIFPGNNPLDTDLGTLFRTSVAAPTADMKVITLGPGVYDLGSFPAFVQGENLLIRGSGRDQTFLVGHGEGHSAWACAIECRGRFITFEDLTLKSDVSMGGQSCVIGYASNATESGARLVIRRCRIKGRMFGVYSWKHPGHYIHIEDSEIVAGCFPIAAAVSNGPSGQYLTIRNCVIRGYGELREPEEYVPTPTGQDETYSTVYGIYARGGTINVFDTYFDMQGSPKKHAVVGIGVPTKAAASTIINVYNCSFSIRQNGALRVADIEIQNPGINPIVIGGTGHTGGEVEVVYPTEEHIEQ